MALDEVLACAARFIHKVEQQGIPIEAAYLFGSWAQDRATKWSDIDVAIISSSFEGTRFYDRRKMDRAVLAVDSGIRKLSAA